MSLVSALEAPLRLFVYIQCLRKPHSYVDTIYFEAVGGRCALGTLLGALLALLGARASLLETKGISTSNKKLLGTRASLLGERTLLGAPGIATRSDRTLLATRATHISFLFQSFY